MGGGGFACRCRPGYAGDGYDCVEIDECADALDDCDPWADCINTDGSYTCACPLGLTGDGRTCLDVDECATGTAGCHALASCTNDHGGFGCTCNAGYEGDGFECANVDECAAGTHACGGGERCLDTEGSYFCAAPPGTVMQQDDFEGGTIDPTRWQVGVIVSGTEDPSVPVALTNGRLVIGPLFEDTAGLHYNGVSSITPHNLYGAEVLVERTTYPNTATKATMSFTLPIDNQDHYRMFLEDNEMVCEKKIADAKATLCRLPFDPADHVFWRIHHDPATDTMRFSVAPGAAGAPGAWTELASEPRELPLDAVYLELKGGTYEPETAPGTAEFDNFIARAR